MSIPSVFSIFQTAPGPAAPSMEPPPGAAPTVPATVAISTAATAPAPAVNADGTPAAPTLPGATSAAESPLDNFSAMWDTKPNVDTTAPSVLSIDPTKLADATKGINFAQAVPQELAAKALAGDSAAFAQVLNTVTQNAFTKAIQVTSELSQKALDQQLGVIETRMADKFKRMTATSALVAENPVYNHPAAKPLISALESQLAATYPNATPAELKETAKNYLTAFAGQIAPQAVPAAPASETDATQNWGAFFDTNPMG